jgi:hypothetical protein
MTGGMAVEGGNNVEGESNEEEKYGRKAATGSWALRSLLLYSGFTLLFSFVLLSPQHRTHNTPTQLQPHTVHPPTPQSHVLVSVNLCVIYPYY